MASAPLLATLEQLIAAWENEVVEFKEANDNFPTGDIGKYVSALANEANLRGLEQAWLVFGVEDKTRRVVGTPYRREPDRLQSLKEQIRQGTDPSITFRDIHELHAPGGRVLMLEVPPAPRGVPIAWNGHYYARSGQSLGSLGLDKQDEIRNQTLSRDWSAQVVVSASLDDLDPDACARARELFAGKHANRLAPKEVAGWPLTTLLDRAKVTQGGRLTRTALLLLGRPEAAYHLSPHPAQMTWTLQGPEQAYEHFGPPFLLTTTQLFQNIRNIQVRLLPRDQLLPVEVAKYDRKVVLEALHNCIAHQDYARGGRIVVTERFDRLVFENEGRFFDGLPEDYVPGNLVPRRYRNPFLAQAMSELNMIDTLGYGIHGMYEAQRRRYFPMPDYDLRENSVGLTLYGAVVVPAYTQLLMDHTDLPLMDVLALDRVQKNLSLPPEMVSRLRRAGLVEGRRPNLHISATVAAASSQKARYIKTRPFDDQHYAEMITAYVRQYGAATRKELNELLWDKLSDALSAERKQDKISNLLTKLRRQGRILNSGSRGKPEWRLAE